MNEMKIKVFMKGLISFCRLRLNNNSNENIFDELKNSALIRELHVYSSSTGIGNNDNNSQQHKGYGMLLVKTAEEIALQNNFNKIIVIAGVGVREYYKNKCGTTCIEKHCFSIHDYCFLLIKTMFLLVKRL